MKASKITHRHGAWIVWVRDTSQKKFPLLTLTGAVDSVFLTNQWKISPMRKLDRNLLVVTFSGRSRVTSLSFIPLFLFLSPRWTNHASSLVLFLCFTHQVDQAERNGVVSLVLGAAWLKRIKTIQEAAIASSAVRNLMWSTPRQTAFSSLYSLKWFIQELVRSSCRRGFFGTGHWIASVPWPCLSLVDIRTTSTAKKSNVSVNEYLRQHTSIKYSTLRLVLP